LQLALVSARACPDPPRPAPSLHRRDRESARDKAEAALRASEAEKRARFEAALQKGNWASRALKTAVTMVRCRVAEGSAR
jgi:hypothetical protein